MVSLTEKFVVEFGKCMEHVESTLWTNHEI